MDVYVVSVGYFYNERLLDSVWSSHSNASCRRKEIQAKEPHARVWIEPKSIKDIEK